MVDSPIIDYIRMPDNKHYQAIIKEKETGSEALEAFVKAKLR